MLLYIKEEKKKKRQQPKSECFGHLKTDWQNWFMSLVAALHTKRHAGY